MRGCACVCLWVYDSGFSFTVPAGPRNGLVPAYALVGPRTRTHLPHPSPLGPLPSPTVEV